MREWWQRNVEVPLNRTGIQWDALFLVMWIFIMFVTIVAGGR